MTKPLGQKAYGSIPHLSGSRLGPKDYSACPGHEQILTVKARKGDTIVVEEKLDGSCCAIAKIDGEIVPLGRAGYRADSSNYRQHHMFAAWVYARQERLLDALQDGQRLVGEWLLQAHGTRYDINDVDRLFRPFDVMVGTKRLGRSKVAEVSADCGLLPVSLISFGAPLSIADALGRLPVWAEGAVWRCENERFGVETLAKFVRHDKVDGALLPEISGGEEVWNFDPRMAAAA